MKAASTLNKLRGGYYTPAPIAHFLAHWGVRSPADVALEPSCGDGNILLEVARRSAALGGTGRCVGVELAGGEARKAAAALAGARLDARAEVVEADFFAYAERALEDGRRFDAVVGNPPFIRYQDFPEAQRERAFALMRQLGLKPSRLANSWLPFVAVACALLTHSGRLAMVVPAELFQVGYAAELRQFLATFFARIDLVAFDALVFDGIQQEVVLVLADRDPEGPSGVRVHEIGKALDLAGLDLGAMARVTPKPVDHGSEKWTKYFLDPDEITLLRELRSRPDVLPVGHYIDVDVGLVTGENDFFLLDQGTRAEYRLDAHTVPIVGRSAALAGVRFTADDFDAWTAAGKKAHLFFPQSLGLAGVQRYIERGHALGVSGGYKCRIRREWYVVPGMWRPDVFFLRQADTSPRMVANETAATCTDTLHRGRLRNGASAERLSTAFLNSLTFAASEVAGRSYGGGVMTFEPSEMERLPLPTAGAEAVDPAEVDTLVRGKRLDAALNLVDDAVLVRGHGLSRADVLRLRAIWAKLRDRRRARKQSRQPSARADQAVLEPLG